MLRSQQNVKPTPLLAAVLLRLGRNVEAGDVVTDFRRANPSSGTMRDRLISLASHLRVKWIGDLDAIGFGE
jgi:hypothetical protein